MEERERILDALEQSDLNLSEFARQNGLSRVLLSVWLSRYRRKPAPGVPTHPMPQTEGVAVGTMPFQELQLSQLLGQAQTGWAAEVVLPAGITVRLDPPGRDQLLRHLLAEGLSLC